MKIKDVFKKNAGNAPLSAGTASAPTSGHGPTQVARGGKGGAKGGGLSGSGLSGGGNGGEAGNTRPPPIEGKNFDPGIPMFRSLAIDRGSVTLRGDRK